MMTPEGGNFGLNSPNTDPSRRIVKDEISIGNCTACPAIENRLAVIQYGVDQRSAFTRRRLSEDLGGLIADVLGRDLTTFTDDELQRDKAFVRSDMEAFLNDADDRVAQELGDIEDKCQSCPGATLNPNIVNGLGNTAVLCNNPVFQKNT